MINKDMVLDGIAELNLVIVDNYAQLPREEIAIEFNIGSRLGETKKYLFIYNNTNIVKIHTVLFLKRRKMADSL